MVSLKRYLNNNGAESTLREAAALLIEKIGEYAVAGDSRELEVFGAEIKAIHEALTPDLPVANLLTLAGSATKALDTYNRRITKRIGRQGTEFHAIIRMVEDSLVKTGCENAEFVQSLGRIDEELQRYSGFQDLQSLKLHLGTCLSNFRDEIKREKTAAQERIEKLQSDLENFREPGARAAPASPATSVGPDRAGTATKSLSGAAGPLSQEDCLQAIREAIEAGTRHYVLVMVVNRVQPIIARFGKDAGNRMLARLEEYLDTQLFASEPVFRWTGPSMVAVLERPQGLEGVRALVRRMLETQIEENYDIGGRSVLIPISVAWTLFTLSSPSENTISQIQTFIASQGCRDFA